jgi:hypothetical protein
MLPLSSVPDQHSPTWNNLPVNPFSKISSLGRRPPVALVTMSSFITCQSRQRPIFLIHP